MHITRFTALLLMFLMAGCQTVIQPSQSAWQYTYAYLDYHQLEFLKETAQETFNSVAVIPEYKSGIFTGQWPNYVIPQVESVDKLTLENLWKSRVKTYQAAFSKVETKPLHAMLDMLEKHKLQQLQHVNPGETAISIGRSFNTDLVVLISFQGLH